MVKEKVLGLVNFREKIAVMMASVNLANDVPLHYGTLRIDDVTNEKDEKGGKFSYFLFFLLLSLLLLFFTFLFYFILSISLPLLTVKENEYKEKEKGKVTVCYSMYASS